jgi:hypothetical protein
MFDGINRRKKTGIQFIEFIIQDHRLRSQCLHTNQSKSSTSKVRSLNERINEKLREYTNKSWNIQWKYAKKQMWRGL